MNDDIQKQIDELKEEIKKLKALPLEDHRHNGFDVSRVSLKDIETVYIQQTTINPSSLVDGAGETITVSGVTGAVLGDWVMIAPPYDLEGITVTVWISANSTVKLRIQNESGSTVDLASGVWRILIIKKVV